MEVEHTRELPFNGDLQIEETRLGNWAAGQRRYRCAGIRNKEALDTTALRECTTCLNRTRDRRSFR